jgi:pimeloyl-ACP methyl ester carboxylesterase
MVPDSPSIGIPASLTVPDGTDLHLLDFGGDKPLTVFLHGLAGYAGEWAEVVSAIQPELRKVAFDQRGHGHSSRRPADVSRAAHVADVVAVIDHYSSERQPVDLVGQSLGGHTAMLVAGRHPELVSRLVMVEASPEGPSPSGIQRVRHWLDGWPRPLQSEKAAKEFFGVGSRYWLAGMDQSEEGWWPRFDDDIMLATLEAAAGSWWEDWKAVTCPTLLVRGQAGWISDEDVARMKRTGPRASVEMVPGASHDIQLDAPIPLADLVATFLG